MPQGRHDGDVRSYELEGKDGLPNAPIVFDLINVVTKYGREVSDRLCGLLPRNPDSLRPREDVQLGLMSRLEQLPPLLTAP
jgi:hypothetical protein